MYDIFRNRINAGGYQLADIQQRIKKLYALGDLTEDQLDELMALSQRNAAADAERPETLKLLRQLSNRVAALENLMLPKEDDNGETSQNDAWKPWDGINDNYRYGAVVSHNGKRWVSVFNGQNVWEPGSAGTEALWVEYVEEVNGDV